MAQSGANQEQQLRLARLAADGDDRARRAVTELADPLIRERTEQFCKRFCRENRYRYRCTLPRPWGSPPADAPLCEWGNASYAWMLDDLTSARRLRTYAARDGAGLRDYLAFIASSLPFYERWKNWRFGRRVHVPAYVAELAPLAARVFLALRGGDTVPFIAQQLGCAEAEIDTLAQRIVVELTGRGRLHLLDPPRTESLQGAGGGEEHAAEREIPSFDPAPEDTEAATRLRQAWQQLGAVEQFVLESMVVEEHDAEAVLAALREMDVRIADKVPAAQTNRQQLYYFRRKCVARLANLMEQQTS